MDSLSKKVYLIAGLPGSGKTGYALNLCIKLKSQGENVGLIDDASVTDKELKALRDYLYDNNITSIIVTDPYFCEKEIRGKAEEKILSINRETQPTWIFFANDAEQCRKNAVLRTDKEVSGSIDRFEKSYVVPDDVVPLPVWNGEN
jgi:hypothetical protein